MCERSNRVCPVERAGRLDNRIRTWLQNPRKILAPYVREGMTVLDVGCGPGFFSIEMARMAGKSGRVIAVDFQQGMLDKLMDKIKGSELEARITLHKCSENSIGVMDKVDFALAFYLLHEIPNQQEFFDEIRTILKPDGQVLVVEPPFHVSKKAFEKTIEKACDTGLTSVGRPRIFLSKAAILRNEGKE